jgi:hypothetical protein
MGIEKRVVVSCKVSRIWKLEIRKENFGCYVQRFCRYCAYSVGRYSTVRFQEGGDPDLADVWWMSLFLFRGTLGGWHSTGDATCALGLLAGQLLEASKLQYLYPCRRRLTNPIDHNDFF